MELIERAAHAVFAVTRKLACSRDERDEIAQETMLKLSRELLGPFLFTLVKNTAADYYARSRAPLKEDVQDIETRLLGLARIVAMEQADAPAIASMAAERLQSLIDGAYLRTIVKNVAAERWRGKKEVQLETHDDEDTDEALTRLWLRTYTPPADRELPPRSVIEERLRLVFASQSNPAHEAIVYGYNTHLARLPVSIVGELATLTLWELSQSLISRYCEAARIGTSRMRVLLSDLIAVQDSDQADKRLPDFWDPRRTIEDWVSDMDERAASSDASENVSRAGPHRALTYLLCRQLGYQPAKIVASEGSRTLQELSVLFESLYSRQHGIDVETVRARFGPLLYVSERHTNKQLAEYFTPYRSVSDWIFNVKRRYRMAELRQVREGMHIICSMRRAEHQVIVFMYCHCLRLSIHELAGNLGNRLLRDLESDLEHRAALCWEVELQECRAWFQPLRERLMGNVGAKALRSFARDWEHAAEIELSRWRGEVLNQARELLKGKLPLFCYQYNLWSTPSETSGTDAAEVKNA